MPEPIGIDGRAPPISLRLAGGTGLFVTFEQLIEIVRDLNRLLPLERVRSRVLDRWPRAKA